MNWKVAYSGQGQRPERVPNLQAYLPDFLTTPLAHTVMVAVGVTVGSLVIGGALASGRLKVNRHDWARPKLQEFYAAIGRLTERLPANLSAEEFEHYVLRVNHRVAEAADWIGTNLGVSARAKFLDTHGMPAVQGRGAINPRHNNIILNLTRYRENLLAMIENKAGG
jgi:hypothetical protein